MKARGPGDTENAMRTIEREYGIDYWTMWKLRYRRSAIRDIGIAVYSKIEAAYRAECERQLRRLQHEIEITEAIAGPDNATVRAAKALVGEEARREAGGTPVASFDIDESEVFR